MILKKLFATTLFLAGFTILAIVLLDLAYLYHGSLEMFPTEENDEKARISATVALLFLAPLGTICLLAAIRFWRLPRKK